MIDYNFEDSIKNILGSIPSDLEKADDEPTVLNQEKEMMEGIRNYKTFKMFSATMQPYVEKIARDYLKFPAFIQIGSLQPNENIV